jgi:hypothetical protein
VRPFGSLLNTAALREQRRASHLTHFHDSSIALGDSAWPNELQE